MSLGQEVGLGPGDIVLDGYPAPPTQKGAQQPPPFSPLCSVIRSPISATAELLLLCYGDGAGNAAEENSSVFSLIPMCYLPSARHVGNATFAPAKSSSS